MHLFLKLSMIGVLTVSAISPISIRSPSITHAQVQVTSDCSAVVNPNITPDQLPANYLRWNAEVNDMFDVDLRVPTFFTDRDMITAAKTLASYCCYDGGIVSGDSCESIQEISPKYYPQSGYLADHLVTVGMRKMDGIEDHCDSYDIDCTTKSLRIDPVERRKEISDIAQDVQGVSSQVVADLYALYRGTTTDFIDQNTDTMRNAYYRMCNEVDFVDRFVQVSGRQDPKVPILDRCQKLVQSRSNREYLYVKSVLIKKGMAYVVNDNLRTYLREYFLDTRMSGLVDKYIDLSGCYTNVLGSISLTEQCND